MGLNSEGQQVHRPGPLKQSNKKHKGGKSGSKLHKGRISVKAVTSSCRQDLCRVDRKHQANQLRKNKRDAVLSKKRAVGSANAPPILVAIIPLGQSADPLLFLEQLKSYGDGLEVSSNDYGHCHVSFVQQKQRFSFFIPRFDSVYDVMDAAKVADRILFIHSINPFDEYTDMLLSVILAHAVPSTVHILPGLDGLTPKKKSELKKDVLKKIESRFPDEKLFHADTKQELQLILRHLGNQKERPVGFRDARPHLIADKASFTDEDSETRKGTLVVSGYIRGKPLNVNSLVHIPGWGTFQMSQIQYESDPYSFSVRKRSTMAPQDEAMGNALLEKADPAQQVSLQSEVVPDPMESELDLLSDSSSGRSQATKLKPKKIVKKVPEGTSEYQAAWLIGSDVEEDVYEDEESDTASDADSMVTAAEDFPEDVDQDMEALDEDDDDANDDEDYEIAKENVGPEAYDKDINMEEEKQMLVRFKEERMEQMFPDEVDTPMDVTARVKYQKYRGLDNFSESPWDPLEGLPPDYGRIYRFENFYSTKKRVLTSEAEGVPPGSYVLVYIKDVPLSILDGNENQALVVFGLLPHEQKMSVLNVLIKKHPMCKVPIKSKDDLIFHIGFSRFTCRPIFSVNSRGNKFKYEKFLPNGTAVVASFFAPVIFPPASVTVFRQKTDGHVELVATGSLMNVDPNRVIVKRIVLSGHPFKIFKKSAIVRYMFFNKEDIEWFKKVELRTKCGRRGHIREALGSHGHMKCVFDRQLQSQDVVLMMLYKRVFPKWTYELNVPTPVSPYEHTSENMLL